MSSELYIILNINYIKVIHYPPGSKTIDDGVELKVKYSGEPLPEVDRIDLSVYDMYDVEGDDHFHLMHELFAKFLNLFHKQLEGKVNSVSYRLRKPVTGLQFNVNNLGIKKLRTNFGNKKVPENCEFLGGLRNIDFEDKEGKDISKFYPKMYINYISVVLTDNYVNTISMM